ncbi:MAG: MBL fold metallo-hydrolase [Planctomycetes bacterium]|nr:MBL fold metallo-hydrolase [Planctomycetota bacterium]
MELHFLGSGSKGNALAVTGGRTRILLDAGLPAETLQARLLAVGILPSSIDAIAVTHGHHDHVAAAPILSRDLGIVVHAARTTFRDPGRRPANLSILEPGRPFEIGDLRLRPFRIPHDAEPTVGYVVEGSDGASFGYVTDCGHPRPDVIEALQGVRALVLEFNHDEAMLRDGPYPRPLKDRIAGPDGHLSNGQAAEILGRVAHAGLSRVFLAHLSETNNRPALALAAAHAALERACLRNVAVDALAQATTFGPLSI